MEWKRITSKDIRRYNGKNSGLYKKLQLIENLLDKYNIHSYEELDNALCPNNDSVLIAKDHLHNFNENMVCARCECEELVFQTMEHVDYYCSNCGRKIIWDNDLWEHRVERKKELDRKINDVISRWL